MTTDRSDALPIGFILERYRIDGILGDGGFGITYIATHTLMQKQVAIKELFPSMFALREEGLTVRPRGGSDQNSFQKTLDSFLEEAKVLTLFTEHPNIVTVSDYFEKNGTAYLVMQFEQGQTLSEWLADHPNPTEKQLLDIFIPVLDGLRQIHSQKHLHRDIKPENIYIRSNGRPMLIDFGAARQVMGVQSKNLSVVLTDGYAPNEQYSIRGNQGPWTDIYSVGATMWSSINKGEVPPSAPERTDAHMNEDSDPLISAVDLGKGRYSQEFLEAIDSALVTVVTKRPQSVQAFQDRLLKKTVLKEQQPHLEQPQSYITETNKNTNNQTFKHQPIEIQPAVSTPIPTKLIAGVIGVLLTLGLGVWWINSHQESKPTDYQQTYEQKTKTATDDIAIKQQQQRKLEEQEKARIKAQQNADRLNAEREAQQEIDRLAAEKEARQKADNIINKEELAWIGRQIYINEASGDPDKLIHWNTKEDFASLGIGHFIWYPKGRNRQYTETFPQLVQYLETNHVDIPHWLSIQVQNGAPWSSKQELRHSRNNRNMQELKRLLINTQKLQVAFLSKRLTEALPTMLNSVSSSEKSSIIAHFEAVKNSPRGTYPLLDYVHFKGEGTSPSERYNGQGWGLLQVLQEMGDVSIGSRAIPEFVRAAEAVLERRVRNAPAGRNEKRWIHGWKKRLRSYL